MANLLVVDGDLLALEISDQMSTSGEVTLDISAAGPYFPLPDLLQGFLMPDLQGSLTVDADENMSAEVKAQQTSTFALANILEFKDLSGEISIDKSNTAAVVIKATGHVRIGGSFDVNMSAEIDVAEKSMTVLLTHDGD